MSALVESSGAHPSIRRSHTLDVSIEDRLRAYDACHGTFAEPAAAVLVPEGPRAGLDVARATAAQLLVDDHLAGRSSIEEALLEIHHAPLALHGATWAAARLFGAGLELSVLAHHAEIVAQRLRSWNVRPLEREYPHLVLGCVALRGLDRQTGPIHAIRFAVGIDADGRREPLGATVGEEDVPDSWHRFLLGLSQRGLSGVGLAAIPPAEAIEDAVRAHCPTAVVQLQLGPVLDELQWLVTPGLLPRATQATRALHAAPDRRSAQLQARALLDTPGLTSSPGDLQRLRRLLEGTLPYLERPRAHWRHLRSDRLAREVRRAFKQHTCAIASPTDPALLEVLFLARLRWMAKTLWTKRYLAS